MPAWIKVTRPNVEIGTSFVLYQAIVINLDEAKGFGIQNAGSVTVYIDGKAFVVQQQLDAKAYQFVLAYVQKQTGQTLP